MKRCNKGKSCGAACIDPRERCVLELGPLISESTTRVSSLVTSLSTDPDELFERLLSRKSKGTGTPGDIKSLPTRQLQMLSNRPELDPRQKRELMKELATREEEERVRKMKQGGGYALPKESGKIYKQKDLWWKDEEINKQKDIFKERFPDATLKEAAIGGKLLKYGASLSGKTENKPKLEYSNPEYNEQGVFKLVSKVGKHVTVLEVDTGQRINWYVNGSVDKNNVGEITPQEKRQIAVVARKNWDLLVKAYPSGTIFQTSAYDGDGSGPSRVKAYRAMGFGKPDSDYGDHQYAQVSRYGVIPMNPQVKESEKMPAVRWYNQAGRYIPREDDYEDDYSEKNDDLKIEKAIEIILFGDPEQK